MAGLKQFGRVQSAPEVTPGTQVTTATAKWGGLINATWHEERTKDRPEELRGLLARYASSSTMSVLATLDIEATLTFEEIIFILEGGIRHVAAPASDGATPTPAQLWDFTPTLTAPDQPQTYTLQVGNNQQSYRMGFGYCRNFEISFAIGERSRLRASFAGQQLIANTFTPATPADRATENAVGQMWAAYIDAVGVAAVPGTTRYGGCIVNGTWRLPQTYSPHRCIDGTLVFSNVQQMALAPELELTVEMDAAAVAERAAGYAVDTRQLIRLENTGSQIHPATAGPVVPAANKLITIDGAYTVTDWGAVGGADQDGVETVRLMASGEFDTDWQKLFTFQVQNAAPGSTVYATP